MSLGIAVAVILMSLGVAFVATKIRKPIHPEVVVGDVGERPGVVMFTSTDCATCKKAIARLKASSLPFREVTHELEPVRFEVWEVIAVPLTVFIDDDSKVVAALPGVPSRRAIASAARRAGVSSVSVG